MTAQATPDLDPQPAPSDVEAAARPTPATRWLGLLVLAAVCAASIALFAVAVRRMQSHRLPVVIRLSRDERPLQPRTARVKALGRPVQSAVSPDASRLADARLDRFRGAPSRSEQNGRQAVIPIEDRWMIEFDPGLTVGDYADQLDALGVELGVIVDPDTIEYATKLTDSKPKKRSGKLADEQRLYLTWNRGDLVTADRVLLANAEIAASDRVVLHFIPEATQQAMAKLEQEFAKRPPEKIERTVFGLRATFRGYALYVKRQQERQ